MAEISPVAVEAIKMAIQLEKDGRSFFEEAAQKTDNKLAKKMFHSLAKDEIEHLHRFQKIFDAITGEGDWRELADEAPKTGEVPVFEDVVEKKRDVDPSELDALRTAIEVERKAIDFFKKAAMETKDPLAKKIFRTIQEEEEYHYDLLHAQHDYLSRSGVWFDVAEFRMDAKY